MGNCTRIHYYRVDLNKPMFRQSYGVLGEGDDDGDVFVFSLVRNGAVLALTSAVLVTGYFVRPDGNTVILKGEIADNKASITLPQSCYVKEGRSALAVKATIDGATTTIAMLDGFVRQTTTDAVVDPGTFYPSLEDLLNGNGGGSGGGGGGSVAVDATLTMAGMAADAKATGDKIAELSEEIAELKGEPAHEISGVFVEIEPEAGDTIYVTAQIQREANNSLDEKVLRLVQVNSKNLIDVSGLFGGVGTTVEKGGIAAVINADGTVTISGTNTSGSGVDVFKKSISAADRVILPPGDYCTHSDLRLQLYTADSAGKGVVAHGAFTIDAPCSVASAWINYSAGSTVDKTIPLGVFRGSEVPADGYLYSGITHAVTFESDVLSGTYDWNSGKLYSENGNAMGSYAPVSIVGLEGTNRLFTGFGIVTASTQKIDIDVETSESSEINVRDFGAKCDLVTDDTAAINNALANANGKRVVIDAPVKVVATGDYRGVINVPSNTVLEMRNGAYMQLAANSYQGAYIVYVNKAENVSLYNLHVKGDRFTHTGTEGSWGHGVYFVDAHNCYANKITVYNTWGDGVGFSASVATTKCSDITIGDIYVDGASRNGVHVGNIDNLYIGRIVSKNVNRANPEAGVDIEDNYGDAAMTNVYLGSIYTEGCTVGVSVCSWGWDRDNEDLLDYGIEIGSIVTDSYFEMFALKQFLRGYFRVGDLYCDGKGKQERGIYINANNNGSDIDVVFRSIKAVNYTGASPIEIVLTENSDGYDFRHIDATGMETGQYAVKFAESLDAVGLHACVKANVPIYCDHRSRIDLSGSDVVVDFSDFTVENGYKPSDSSGWVTNTFWATTYTNKAATNRIEISFPDGCPMRHVDMRFVCEAEKTMAVRHTAGFLPLPDVTLFETSTLGANLVVKPTDVGWAVISSNGFGNNAPTT